MARDDLTFPEVLERLRAYRAFVGKVAAIELLSEAADDADQTLDALISEAVSLLERFA